MPQTKRLSRFEWDLERPLVLFDLETTGTDPAQAQIIEIAWQRYETDPESPSGLSMSSTESSVIDPGRKVPDQVEELTGISTADVRTGPTMEEVAGSIRKIFEGAVWVAYNARGYDWPLLTNALERHREKPQDVEVVDPYVIERAQRRTLGATLRRYEATPEGGKPLGAHRAGDDVEALWRVLQGQVAAHTSEENRPVTLGLLHDLEGNVLDVEGKLRRRESGAAELTFGRHEGDTLGQVAHYDLEYIQWMWKEMEPLRPILARRLPDFNVAA